MRLRSFVILAAAAYTIIIGGSLLLYRIYIVYPSIEAGVLNQHEQEIRGVYAAYVNERENLILFNQDWSKWDDTYQFASGQNPSFLNKSLHSPFFYRADVDAVAVVDTQGKTFYAAYKKDNELIQVSRLSNLTRDINPKQVIAEDTLFGMIHNQGQLGYFSSHLIQDSLETKEPMGALIFIRYFKEDFVRRLELITNITATLSLDEISNQVYSIDINNLDLTEIQQAYYLRIPNSEQRTIAVVKISYDKKSIPKLLDDNTLISIAALLFLPVFITLLVYVFFLMPITKIANQILSMNDLGRFHYLKLTSNILEINTFINTFNSFSAKILAYQEKLKADSNTDGLTKIYNRRYFDDQFEKAWTLSSRNSTPLCIALMDIDYFKKYNDHYGHQKGDEALKAVAQALKSNLRRSSDVLARYGGEEFVIILQAEQSNELKNTLERLVKAIEDLNIEHKFSDIGDKLTISCGACNMDMPALWMKDHKDAALNIADEALYEAKHKGRNQYRIRTLDKGHSKIQPEDPAETEEQSTK